MKTLSYVLAAEEEIEKGKHYYFGQLWDGEGEASDFFEDKTIAIGNEVIAFEIEKDNTDPMATLVKVTDIY